MELLVIVFLIGVGLTLLPPILKAVVAWEATPGTWEAYLRMGTTGIVGVIGAVVFLLAVAVVAMSALGLLAVIGMAIEEPARRIGLGCTQYSRKKVARILPRWFVDRALLVGAGMTLTALCMGCFMDGQEVFQIGFWGWQGLAMVSFAWMYVIVLMLAQHKQMVMQPVTVTKRG